MVTTHLSCMQYIQKKPSHTIDCLLPIVILHCNAWLLITQLFIPLPHQGHQYHLRLTQVMFALEVLAHLEWLIGVAIEKKTLFTIVKEFLEAWHYSHCNHKHSYHTTHSSLIKSDYQSPTPRTHYLKRWFSSSCTCVPALPLCLHSHVEQKARSQLECQCPRLSTCWEQEGWTCFQDKMQALIGPKVFTSCSLHACVALLKLVDSSHSSSGHIASHLALSMIADEC